MFLDISATIEERKTLFNVVKDTASVLSIPLTVGGGIRSYEDFRHALSSGADKVSINTAAIENPALITRASQDFGAQAVVVAIDAKRVGNSWRVFTKSGSYDTKLDAISWATEVVDLGAGEILLTSIDRDGTRKGYDIELTREISSRVRIPVIASGGAGKPEHFLDVFNSGLADAALAAGIFHDGTVKIEELKIYLKEKGVEVRL